MQKSAPLKSAQPSSTHATRIAEQIRKAILIGELKPGMKINLARLKDRFGVSLSPMREAVTRLTAEGLVESEDQRGYRIAPMSIENLNEVMRLRADVECLAVRYAIAEASLDWESQILLALHKLSRLERNAEDREKLQIWESAHSDFHAALFTSRRSPQLLKFCMVLHNQAARYRNYYSVQAALSRDAHEEHAAIANAAVERNADEACALLRAHILRTGRNLRDWFEASPPANAPARTKR